MENEIINGDSMQAMNSMDAKSVPLIIADPPYNIGKAAWDKIDNYLEWCGEWIAACERVLADNGSFYMFHNEFRAMGLIDGWIRQNTQLQFKQMIIWDKYRGTPQSHSAKGALWKQVNSGGKRNFSSAKEYILFYTFQDETGLSRIYDDRDCFRGIKEYLRAERKKAGITYPEVNTILGTAEGSGQPGHYFSDSQWCLPTAEMYAKLQTTGYFQRPYEELRMEYEELRYTFNQQESNLSIWQFPIPDKDEKVNHPTQKSVALLSHIIQTSSNEGDLVLDPFGGSGTTGVACVRTGRRYLVIDTDAEYCKIAEQRIKAEQAQLRLW